VEAVAAARRHVAAKAAFITCFSGQRHVVSGARMWQLPLDSSGESPSALAGDGDVFAAPGTGAFLAAANRIGHLVGIDSTVGGGGSKFP
jgi:hypothetical protein